MQSLAHVSETVHAVPRADLLAHCNSSANRYWRQHGQIPPDLAHTADYKINRYELPPKLRDTITQRWGHVIRRYGYTSDGDI